VEGGGPIYPQPRGGAIADDSFPRNHSVAAKPPDAVPAKARCRPSALAVGTNSLRPPCALQPHLWVPLFRHFLMPTVAGNEENITSMTL